MAFVNALNPDTPGSTDPVGEGDDRIRELKRALGERLAQVIEGWPDTDPLKLKASELDDSNTTMATIKVGLLAARPSPPDTVFYFATDEDKLYVREPGEDPGVDPDVWVLVNPTATSVGGIAYNRLNRLISTHFIALTVPVGPTALIQRKINTAPLDPVQYKFESVRTKIKLATDSDNEFWWAYGLGSFITIPSHGGGGGASVRVNIASIFSVESATPGLLDWYVFYELDNQTAGSQDVEVTIEFAWWDNGAVEE